jgi:mRNA interferase RelE/StbE
MYKLVYHPRVFKFLTKISKKEAKKIIEKIEILNENPLSEELNVKKLASTKRSFRLRIGNFRVIFEVDFENKIIYIHEVGFRGSIYQ